MKIIILSFLNIVSAYAFLIKGRAAFYLPRLSSGIIPSFQLDYKKRASQRFLVESCEDGSPSSNNYEYIPPMNNTFSPNNQDITFSPNKLLITNTINNITTLPGIMVGVPLNILTCYYTYQHYGENIMTYKIILLQLLIGFYTYGSDSYNDALIYDKTPFKTEKKEIYEKIINNKYFYKAIYSSLLYIIIVTLFDLNANIFDSINCLLLYESAKRNLIFGGKPGNVWGGVAPPLSPFSIISFFKRNVLTTITPFTLFTTILLIAMNELDIIKYLPFVLLLDSTNNYVDLKKNNGILKPFYVSFMWVTSILILPCVIHDNNYSILNTPKDYILPFLVMFSLTNLADIKDITEDKKNNIETIPVKFGLKFTYMISICSIILYYGINTVN